MYNHVYMHTHMRIHIMSLSLLSCSRLVLILTIAVAAQNIIIVEQPTGSLMERHPRWRWFVDYVIKVFKMQFFMGSYGGSTAKSHVLYSNEEHLLEALWKPFDRARFRPTIQVTTQSVSSSGVKRVTGKKALKSTQCLPQQLSRL